MTDIVERLRSPANVFYEYAADNGAFLREAADEIEQLREALREAENALSDYVPTLEAKGHMMGYGKYVLAKVRTALGKKE